MKIADEIKSKIIADLTAGGSVRSVAKTHGVSETTAQRLSRAAGIKQERKSRQNTVAVRLSGDEARALDRALVDLGYENRSDCLRGLVRTGMGFVELSRADAEGMDELRLQTRRIGTNVNQMARAANRRDLPLMG